MVAFVAIANTGAGRDRISNNYNVLPEPHHPYPVPDLNSVAMFHHTLRNIHRRGPKHRNAHAVCSV
jgi:hypothetical protein